MPDTFPWINPGRTPYLLGHRGVKAKRPENTIASFRHAIELGVAIIELDVQLSRDGRLMVIHDERVDRTTDGTGDVAALSAKALRRLDAGARFDRRWRGERIPFLEEVFDLLRPTGIALNVEVKNGPLFPKAMAGKVIRAIERSGMAGRVVVSSFDHGVLKELKTRAPRIVTAALVVNRLHDPVGYLRRLGANGLHPRWNYVTAADVKHLHAAGFFVNTWVVNDPETFATMKRLKLDAVGTDDPKTMMNAE